MSWLRGLHFDDLCSQATLVDYLWGVEMLVARRAALIAAGLSDCLCEVGLLS